MKDRTCSVDALAVFVKETVIPTGERIHTLRGDSGTEFTSVELRQNCQDVGIKLEFASSNTPQQIGVNEHVRHTIWNMLRYVFADWTLPNLLWGELVKDGRLSQQPDSSRSSAKRDAVQGALRQGCLSRPPPDDRVSFVRARRGQHQ